MNAGIALDAVRAGYGAVEVLHELSLAFPSGAVTAVLGRNGAGKTTALRTLAGAVRPASGQVLWDGADVTAVPTDERARRGLCLVPAEHAVFGDLTVEDNLTLFGDGAPPDVAFSAFPVLRERYKQRAGTLSGGEQQMLALSRALLRQAPVVLLDEISRGLAPRVVAGLYAAVRRFAGEDRCVVVVEQYAEEALRLADLVYVLRRGEVSFAGEPGELDRSTLAAAFG